MDKDRVEAIAIAVRGAIEMCDATELPWQCFPHGACGDTTLVLGQVLHDAGITGFEYICGNKYKEYGACSSHAWLKNGEWIVDITADQFPDIDESVIVKRNSEWHDQWQQDRPTPSTLHAYGTQVPQLWRLLSLLKPRLSLANKEKNVSYEADIADKLGENEVLDNRRAREEGSRGNVDIEEFDIVGAGGRIVGVLTVRESMDPNPPFFTERTVTRRDL